MLELARAMNFPCASTASELFSKQSPTLGDDIARATTRDPRTSRSVDSLGSASAVLASRVRHFAREMYYVTTHKVGGLV